MIETIAEIELNIHEFEEDISKTIQQSTQEDTKGKFGKYGDRPQET